MNDNPCEPDAEEPEPAYHQILMCGTDDIAVLDDIEFEMSMNSGFFKLLPAFEKVKDLLEVGEAKGLLGARNLSIRYDRGRFPNLDVKVRIPDGSTVALRYLSMVCTGGSKDRGMFSYKWVP